ncbi:hypothetical protein [Pantoea vagans]|jgi:hypothetical protein|uniref:hypothetical protein n=1 Tax=Pantoea vagans TaxID=470934 RepID=UPI00289C0D41|nr:hypothetical protein [Pantoea vagans]
MSEALYMWVIGGYFVLMAVFTKVAYSDPNFYTGFLEKVIATLTGIIFLCSGSLWLGLSIGHTYAVSKLNLTPEQLKMYSTDYNNFTNPISLVYLGSIIAYGYSFFLTFLAETKRKSMIIK